MDFDETVLAALNDQARAESLPFAGEWEQAMQSAEGRRGLNARSFNEIKAVLIGTAGAAITGIGLASWLFRSVNLQSLLNAVP
jgi:hypothetical protein